MVAVSLNQRIFAPRSRWTERCRLGSMVGPVTNERERSCEITTLTAVLAELALLLSTATVAPAQDLAGLPAPHEEVESAFPVVEFRRPIGAPRVLGQTHDVRIVQPEPQKDLGELRASNTG
jgi:hypothetical protein